MMNQRLVAGIDIGGTNIEAGWVLPEGKVLSRGKIKTRSFATPQDMVHAVAHMLGKQLSALGAGYEVLGVGVGAPSSNFYSGCMEHAPNMPWPGIIPLAKLFEGEMKCPAYLTNDANAAALGEMIFGGAKGISDFVMVTLGTGLGSGFVSSGKLLYGHDGHAGELGHTIAVANGRPCGCGRKGCLETYASATGIVKTAIERLASEHEASVLDDIAQEKISAYDITMAARNGDKLALEIFEFTAEILGMKLADTVAITSPKAIFLFGGLAHARELLSVPLKKYMELNLLNLYQNKVDILFSQMPDDDAALLGAASLVWQEQA
jgi:glucokinase